MLTTTDQKTRLAKVCKNFIILQVFAAFILFYFILYVQAA